MEGGDSEYGWEEHGTLLTVTVAVIVCRQTRTVCEMASKNVAITGPRPASGFAAWSTPDCKATLVWGDDSGSILCYLMPLHYSRNFINLDADVKFTTNRVTYQHIYIIFQYFLYYSHQSTFSATAVYNELAG